MQLGEIEFGSRILEQRFYSSELTVIIAKHQRKMLKSSYSSGSGMIRLESNIREWGLDGTKQVEFSLGRKEKGFHI